MGLVWVGLAWLAGIVLGVASTPTASGWLLLGAGAAISIFLFRRYSTYRWLFSLLLIACLGGARMRVAQPRFDAGHVAAYNDGPGRVMVQGVVIRPPDVRDDHVILRVQAERLYALWGGKDSSIDGLVLVRAPRFGGWRYGDRIRVFGQLETPPEFERFSYREYLARQGIYSVMSRPSVKRLSGGGGNPLLRLVFNLRREALGRVQALFPDPEASLLAGILLGVESGIPEDVQQAFQATGTAHIIAISGFNITIIAGLLTSVFSRLFGRRLGLWMAGLGIGVYTILVGADAAVVRAAIMGGLALFAQRIGRQTHGLTSLSAAAIGMSLVNPQVLGDVSFQLSFAATLGLLLYARPLERLLVRLASRWFSLSRAEALAGPAGEIFLYTLAAQLTTTPLMMYHFREISLISLIANAFILPLQPAVMLLGGGAAVLSLIWMPLGQAMAWIAWPFVGLTIMMVSLFSGLPLAALPLGEVAPLAIVGVYLLIFGLTAGVRSGLIEAIRLPAIRVSGLLGTAALMVCTAIVWKAVADRPDGRLHVTVLDVGSGDAVLVESPTGRYVLIDGGPSPIEISKLLGERLPLFHRQLDYVILAGDRYGQVAGLAGIAERFPIGTLMVLGDPAGSAYANLIMTQMESGNTVLQGEVGHRLELGAGSDIELIGNGANGGILIIGHGSMRILLASGSDPDLIARLLEEGGSGPVQVAVLGGGGGEAVNPKAWLNQLDPWIAIISVEAGNEYGLPSPSVLEHLAGRIVLRTDQHGWIRITSDGERMWVRTERARGR